MVSFDLGVYWTVEGVEKAFDSKVRSCRAKTKGLEGR